MIYHLTTNSIIQLITAGAAFITIGFMWKSRKSSEAKFMIIVQMLASVWAIAYALEFSTPALTDKIFWSKMSYIGIAFLPASYYFFATAFSQKKKFLTPLTITLLLVIPVVTLFLVFTNEKHQFVWSSVTLDAAKNMAYYQHGPWFWVFYSYSETMLLLGVYNLISSVFKFTGFYKIQIAALVTATLIPITGNLMYVLNLNPYPGFDWTPVSFVLSGLIITFGIFRFRMFDIVPFARIRLFDVINDGAIVINENGFIEDCNTAAYNIFNLQHKSIIHEPFNAVFKKYEALTEGINCKLATIQIEIKHEDRFNYYQVKISPIYREKKFSGNILLFHNITINKNTEEELKNTNRKLLAEIEKREKLIEDLDAFAHTVAHDLRNSLSSIFSASEIMEELIKQNDKNLLSELSNLINHSANKSIQITQELLVLATTDKTQVERKSLDMTVIFAEAKKQLADLIKNTNAEITEPADWPQAFGYAPWIEEVWTNYISNAVKYGGIPPKIEVGADTLKNGRIRFWIKDNGPGLSKDEQNRLFKNFVRLHPQRADGYGLGLSIVKKIIEKLDGSIGVESKGNGNGSKFFFVLPPVQNNPFLAVEKLNEKPSFAVN